jgi:hypothetical protein
MAHRTMSRLTRLQHDRRGVSAIEFAMIALMTVSITFAGYDLGNAAHQQIRLQEAVRLAGAYAGHWPTDIAGIRAAVTGALPAEWELTTPGGVATIACSCVNPASGVTSTLTGCTTSQFDTCDAGSGLLVSITATMAYSAIDPMFAAALPQLGATYVIRFQ